MFGSDSIATSTTARFLDPFWDDGLAPLVGAIVQFRAVRAGTLQNMRVRQNRAGVGGATITYTVRLNNVATALTVGMLATALDGTDLVNTVAVAAGDLVDLEVTKSAAITTSPDDIVATMEFV